jgi:hypothetical protein
VSASMDRLCERPGCSDTASVAYGMRPEDLVFWLDRLDTAARESGGVLCRRHADSMVVPRSWTLDDLRDPDLHLFRPPEADPSLRRSRRSAGASAAEAADAEQLALGVETTSALDTNVEPAVDDVAPIEGTPIFDAVSPIDPVEPWSPSFDDGDDLDGLLAARSPLLARAFRGDDRPRS